MLCLNYISHITLAFVVLACIKTVNAFEIKAFADFLHVNYLKTALIVKHETAAYTQKTRIANDLKALMANVSVRFCNVPKDENNILLKNFYYGSTRVGILLQAQLTDLATSKSANKIFATASCNHLFNNTQAWFIIVDTDNATATWSFVRETFANYDINIDADITIALKNENNSLQLYDIYKICHECGSPLVIETKGFWSLNKGLEIIAKFRDSFVRRRRNFQNISLKAGTTIQEKPRHLTKWEHLLNTQDNKQYDAMQRKTYQLLKLMEPLLNMSFDIKFYDKWGTYMNGKWDGVIGDTIAHKIEATICPLRFNALRINAMHFTPVLHREVIRFILRHPRRNSIRNIFFEPLTNQVWWSILALIGLTILLLTIHVYYEYKQQRKRQRNVRQQQQRKRISSLQYKTKPQRQLQLQEEKHAVITLEPRLDYIILIILEAIFMQGPSPNTFNFTSTRTLIITICVFSIILMQFYAAFIVGSLLADTPRTLTTMQALYNSTFDIGMENVSYNYEIFINTSNQIIHDIYEQRICKQPAEHILTMEEGMKRIGQGGFAFHASVDRAFRILKSMLTEAEFCDLQEISMNPSYKTSATLYKGSPYRNYFAYSILLFASTGLMQHNEKNWEVRKIDCSLIKNKEVEVDLKHFIPALAFLALAMIASSITLLMECAWKYWFDKKAHTINN